MPAEAMDRVEALRVVFRSLDDDDSGSLDMDEVLRLLVEGVCQRLTLDEAIAYFETLDADGDGTIDEEEYVAAMLHITRDYTAEEFEHEVKHLIARSRKAIEDPKYYFHCDGNREYLGDEVAPLLEKGLEALLSAVEKERLRVATGVDWDEDGYRPDDWRPLRPLRFLGEWLRRNSRTGRAEVAAEEARLAAERAKYDWRDIPFEKRTREEKLRTSFEAMDRDDSGSLDFDEMLFVCRKINPGRGLEETKSQVEWLDKDGDGQVDAEEYVAAMTQLMEEIDDETFDEGVKKVLTAVTFAYATREEKLKMVFDRVDDDGSGELDREEMTKLARALTPGGDEAKVRKTLKWLDKDGDAAVTFDEFKTPILEMTSGLDDDQYDAAIHKLLAADGEATEPDPAEELPTKFAAYVSNLKTHATARQMGVKRLNSMAEQKKKIAVVDCRAEDERAVSTIKDSIALSGIAASGASEEEMIASVTAAIESGDLSAADGCDFIVVMSSVGLESGVAAPLIAEKLGEGVDVFNLCGGIVSWFNHGGEVVDGAGEAVEAVHPGTKRCIGFVLPRKNAFKFGGGGKKKKDDDDAA